MASIDSSAGLDFRPSQRQELETQSDSCVNDNSKMGTFLPLDDLDPTLSDVLAFINDFDNSDSSQDSLTSSPSEDDPVASSSEATAKRKKSRAAASRRFQHKKKAELLALRAQASSLKKRLKELSDNGNGSKSSIVGRLDGTQTQKLVAMWLGKAQLEKHLRLTAETENQQLKRALARQKYTAKVVGHLLHNVTSVVRVGVENE
uniref:BZIP domain-containing protein n=1 Tax=Phytophthora ramorum TaxID=164328 RepID=H3GPY0_PHYRM